MVKLLKPTYSGYTLYGVGDGNGCHQWSRKIVVTLLKRRILAMRCTV